MGDGGRWEKRGDGGRRGGEEVGEADPSLWGGGVGEGEEGRSCQTSCFIVSGHIAYFDII